MRFALVSAVLLILSACAEGTGSAGPTASRAGKTDAERTLEAEVRSLNQVTRNIVVSNTVQGAVAGAVVGCGLALVLGGDSKDCATYAAVGGVGGGIAGNQVGQRAAAAQTELVKQDEIIANLQGINTKLDTVSSSLRAVVNSQNAEISSLRRQVANNQITASSYNSRVNAINSNRQNVIQGLEQSEGNVTRSYQELVTLEQDSGQRLTQSKNAARSTERRLASLRSSVALVPTS